MTEREQAVSDCKYARSLSVNTLNSHIGMWTLGDVDPDEQDYQDTIREIKSKLGTEECLLK